MEFDVVFFAINLAPFITGLVALLRNETNMSDYVLDWIGALLFGLAAVASLGEVQDVLGTVPQFEFWLRISTTFLGVVLTSKGYWPSIRNRVMPRFDGIDNKVYTSKY